jgi:hypothetical protein
MPKFYEALPVVIIPKAEEKFRTAATLLHILSESAG